MRASIIIPTYNRLPILKRCLECLANQQDVDLSRVEVLVVDDGSTDGTTTWLDQVVNSNQIPNPKSQVPNAGYPFQLRYFHQENKGQGNARNLALDHATGNIVFFIGDDILFHPDCLAQHLAVHDAFPDETVACLGFTTWHHELPVSNFMTFLEHGGHQFAYGAISRKNKTKKQKDPNPIYHIPNTVFEASFWFFYTSNVSVKRRLIDHSPVASTTLMDAMQTKRTDKNVSLGEACPRPDRGLREEACPGLDPGVKGFFRSDDRKQSRKQEPGSEIASSPFTGTFRTPRNDEPLRFAPVYTSYGWEDTEFGYRLEHERGMKLLYNPAAKAEHHHIVTIEGFEQKMRSIAKNALIFHDRFPEVPVLPNAFKRFVFRILSLKIILWKLKLLGKFSHKIERLYFYARMKKYWMEGL